MATPTPGPGQTPLYGLPQEQRNLQQVRGRAWVRVTLTMRTLQQVRGRAWARVTLTITPTLPLTPARTRALGTTPSSSRTCPNPNPSPEHEP